jgi:hypothetical protein
MSDYRLKMIFGFTLMIALVVLAAIVALGKVSETTSFGLQYILGALSTLTGAFAQWAFSGKPPEPPSPPQ